MSNRNAIANKHSPKSPADMDWATYYPAYAVKNENSAGNESHDQTETTCVKAISRPVEFADIGCGYGGLTFALAERYPEKLVLGRRHPSHIPLIRAHIATTSIADH